MSERVAVMGAAGHTGSFVVAELRRRGVTAICCGRGTDLDRALRSADAVINCAGPFAATAAPVIESAIRAGIPYLDVTAEIEVVADTFARYGEAGVPVVPAAAFYGGLADLLATAAMGDWPAADHLTVAYALSSWRPTPGTRATGRVSAQRRNGRRVAYTGHRLQTRLGDAPRTQWTFPAPIGAQSVLGEFTMADSATIPTHLDVPEISTFMSANAIEDLNAPDPSGPAAVDEQGRSAQTFLVEVVARSHGLERRAAASGRDIYAVTAPLAVEAAVRILAGTGDTPGVASLGARFDATDFLTSLSPRHLTLRWQPARRRLSRIQARSRLAASALVGAAATGGWDAMQPKIASWFGRGRPARKMQRRLTATRNWMLAAAARGVAFQDAATAREVAVVRAAQVREWDKRFAEVLAAHPDAAGELDLLMGDLRACLAEPDPADGAEGPAGR